MITIKKVKAIIKGNDYKSYGFEYSFNKGLNIISGNNSSGKSTILSCIYYCLGMEQLLGARNSEGLDDSIRNRFWYNGIEIGVIDSYAELTIENDKSENAILTRIIKSAHEKPINVIRIRIQKKESTKFIHAKGDSDNNEGFFYWLSKFSNIKIPEHDGKIMLYLQQIFSCALVEQTKGWSDFFAQIPNFNTQKPKQKIVEYLFNMNSLLDDYKADKLKEEEKNFKSLWSNEVKVLEAIISSTNIINKDIAENYRMSISSEDIKKSKLIIKKSEEKFELDNYIKILESELERNNKKKDKVDEKKNINPGLLLKFSELSEKLQKLKSEYERVNLENINEIEKQSNYKKLLEQKKFERQTLENLSKINSLESINSIDFKSCPVCNSPLTEDFNSKFNNVEKISTFQSISFYKSEIELIESYLKNSNELTDRFERTKLYYSERINSLKIQTDEINKEIISDERIPSRNEIFEELQSKLEIEKLNNILKHYDVLKQKLLPITDEISKINYEIKKLKENKNQDEEIVKTLQKEFKKLLKEFDYPKELLEKVEIKNQEPSRLLPVINSGDNSPHPIRLKSSASDFIRSIWAFYITILKHAKNQIGFLVFDEPGQHAMDPGSMKSLLKICSNLRNNQMILAISKDKDKQEFSLNEILNGLVQNKDYNLNIIEDNGRSDKCVQLLS